MTRRGIQNRGFRKAASLALVSFALTTALHSPAARADDLESVCGSTLGSQASKNPEAESSRSQKLQYCKAAKSAEAGANADAALWKVWAAVGVVCTYGCAASFTSAPSSEYVCMGATLSGGIADAVATQQFAGVLTSIGGVGAGFAANYALNSANSGKKAATESGEAAKKDKDIGACINAAMAAMQAYSKHSSMKSSEESVRSNLEAAKKIGSAQGTGADGSSAFSPQAQAAAAQGGATGDASAYNAGYGATGNAPAGGTSSACSTARATASAGTTLQCALATDRNLPGFVSDPKFAKQFQRDSGQGLSDFLTKSSAPGPLMGGAMSNGMTSAQATKLAQGLNDLEARAGAVAYDAGDASGSAYSAGGGGSRGGSEGDSMPDMGAMMAGLSGLMEQLSPGKKTDDGARTGVNAVIFANRTRSPASVAEDRTLNIFDRVTFRYSLVGKRIVNAQSSPQEVAK